MRTLAMAAFVLFLSGCTSSLQADDDASAQGAQVAPPPPMDGPENAASAVETEEVHFNADYRLLVVDPSGEQASQKTTTIPTALVGAPVSIRATMEWSNGLAPLRACLIEFRGPAVKGIPCIEGQSPLKFEWSNDEALADGAYDFGFSSPSGLQAFSGLSLVAEATIVAGTAGDSS